MPDFSLSDAPWLLQTADAGGSLAKGASAGAAIANARAQRQSLAQRRYEFEQARQLQQRDQALQEKLAPLQEQALRMQNDLVTYKLDDLKKQLTMREANAKIVNEVGSLVLESVLSGKAADPQSVATVADLVSRAPHKNDPELLKWLDVYNEGVKAQHTIKQQRDYQIGGQAVAVTDAQGNVLGYERPGATAPHFIAKPKPEEEGGSASTLGKLVADRNFYHKSGNADIASKFDAAIQTEITPKGWSLTTNPDGTVNIAQGPASSSLPAAMITKLTERMSQALEGITALTELQGDVRWKDVGVPGVLGELVFDTALPMLGIPAGDIQRMATRQKIILTREGLMRDISGDSRFNQADRAAVEASLPKSGLLTTKTQLQEAAQVTKQTLAKRAALDAIDLKQTPPKWALENMTDKQIDALLGSNVITPQMLLQAIENGFSKERAIKLWQARPRG